MAAGIGNGLVNQLKEFAAVHNLDKRSTLAVGCRHPDGWGVLDADALAQCVVGLHESSKLALGIDGKGSASP